MANAKKASDLGEFFEAAGIEVRDYSGRGMGGERCLGVECDSALGMLVRIAQAAVDMAETVQDLADVRDLFAALARPRTDSMGSQQILYWPGVEWDLNPGNEVCSLGDDQ